MFHTPEFVLLHDCDNKPVIFRTKDIDMIKTGGRGSVIWNKKQEFRQVQETVKQIMQLLVTWSEPC